MLNDTTALVNYIVANHQDGEGFGLTADVAHWAEYGITTIPQLQVYLLQSDIWELYKEVYGIRPRHLGLWSNEWTFEALEAEYASLVEAAKVEFARQEEMDREAVAAFERKLADLVAMGAGDRETAFRWLTDGYEGQCASQGALEYEFGVPFGTFAEFFQKEVA